MQKFVIVLFLFCMQMVSALYGQGGKNVKPLKVGDKMPDIVFNKVLNYKTGTAKLSDFKGKLIILDLWATTCTSCIAAFPEMTALQKKFKEQIQILLVNHQKSKYETEERIKNVLDKFKIRTGYYADLPIPIADTILNQYFPHESVPHEVWINEKGIIVGITSRKDVNETNIIAILMGKDPNMSVKDDYIFDDSKPFLVDGNGTNDSRFIYRSLLTNYKRDYNGPRGGGRGYDRYLTGFFLQNQTLWTLVQTGFKNEIDNLPVNRWIFEVKDKNRYKRTTDTANMYCYDLVIPPTFSEAFKIDEYLKEDLKRVFNISVRKESRKLKTWVLTATGKLANAHTKFSTKEIDTEENSIRKFLHNYPVGEIIMILNSWFSEPLIDETGINANIDIDFPDNFDMSDEKGIIEVLRKTGFEIRKEERELEVVVITDKKKPTGNAISKQPGTLGTKEQIQQIKNQKKDASINYVLQNLDSFYSPIVISNLLEGGDISFNLAKSLVEKLETEVQNSLWGRIIKAQTENNRKFYIGNTALPGNFKIEGSLAGLKKGDTLYLLHRKFQSDPPDTTIQVVNGEEFFFIAEAFQGPSFYRLKKDRHSNNTLLMFLENSPVKISGNLSELQHSKVTGSKSHAAQEGYKKLIFPYDAEINRLSKIK